MSANSCASPDGSVRSFTCICGTTSKRAAQSGSAADIWPWSGQCDPVGSIPALDLTSTVIRRPAVTCLLGNFLAGLLTAIVVLGQMT
jgi:hypothetical protein